MKNKEIERKYLFNDSCPEAPKTLTSGFKNIVQHYLPFFRIRKSSNIFGKYSYFLTYKRGSGLVRTEFELETPRFVFDVLSLWPFKTTVKKYRYLVEKDSDKEVVIDELYELDLKLVEVEFRDLESSLNFDTSKYPFIGADVTNDNFYTNKNLAR